MKGVTAVWVTVLFLLEQSIALNGVRGFAVSLMLQRSISQTGKYKKLTPSRRLRLSKACNVSLSHLSYKSTTKDKEID